MIEFTISEKKINKLIEEYEMKIIVAYGTRKTKLLLEEFANAILKANSVSPKP